jgi:hypothetical protein
MGNDNERIKRTKNLQAFVNRITDRLEHQKTIATHATMGASGRRRYTTLDPGVPALFKNVIIGQIRVSALAANVALTQSNRGPAAAITPKSGPTL